MRTIKKGDYGYVRSQKMVRLFRTLFIFLAAFAVLLIGMALNGGDKKNIYTVIAMVGCIPGALSLVSAIMMWMRKPLNREIYERIEAHAEGLEIDYELYLTTYEINLFLGAIVSCGEYLTAYTPETGRRNSDIRYMEEHLEKSLRADGYTVTARIFDSEKKFIERLDALREKQSAYETGREDAILSEVEGLSL